MAYFETIILLFACIALYIYLYLRKTYSYFEQHGIPHLKPDNWILGNMMDIFWWRIPFAVGFQDIHRKLEPHKFGGIFQLQKPTFIFRDPELIKAILIKDFDHFQNHSSPPPNDADPFTMNLFNLKGTSNSFFTHFQTYQPFCYFS